MKKRMAIILMVVLAMALTTMTASAGVTKYVTVKIYKHSSVTASNSTLKSYTSSGMSRIKDAVYYGSSSDTDGHVTLSYTIAEPEAKSDWGSSSCSGITPKDSQAYAIYYVQGIMAQVGFASGTAGYAVIDLAPDTSGCSGVFNTTKTVAVTHEFGHVYNIKSNHDNTVGKCVMDKIDAKAGYSYFCDACKHTIHAYVESKSQNLN